jgi:hypothetical protein
MIGPALVTDTYLREYLMTLKIEGYSIFLVQGSFPRIQEGSSTDGRGSWLPIAPIIADRGRSLNTSMIK